MKLFNEEIGEQVHKMTGKDVYVTFPMKRPDGTTFSGLYLNEETRDPVFDLTALTERDRADLVALAYRILDELGEESGCVDILIDWSVFDYNALDSLKSGTAHTLKAYKSPKGTEYIYGESEISLRCKDDHIVVKIGDKENSQIKRTVPMCQFRSAVERIVTTMR